MTGFGKAEIKNREKGERIYCEIRSFNHKFLELSFSFTPGYNYLEFILKKEILKRVNRGRVNLVIEIDLPQTQRFFINKQLAKSYFLQLEDLRKRLSLKESIDLSTLVSLPEILKIQPETDNKIVISKIKKVFKIALERFLKNREELGEAIYKEIKNSVELLKERLWCIKKRALEVIKKRAQAIENPEERINFLNSRDVSEEISLLNFHIKNMAKKLETKSPIGKELDFILQEMQREINTLGAKSFDPKVISWTIEIKTHIEKIRQQVQNVE